MGGKVIGQHSEQAGKERPRLGGKATPLSPGRRQPQREDQLRLVAQSSPPWALGDPRGLGEACGGPAALRFDAAARRRRERPYRAGPGAPGSRSRGPRTVSTPPFSHTLGHTPLWRAVRPRSDFPLSTMFLLSFHCFWTAFSWTARFIDISRMSTMFHTVCAAFGRDLQCFCLPACLHPAPHQVRRALFVEKAGVKRVCSG